MIYQNDTFENTENLFDAAVKDLQIGKLLHQSSMPYGNCIYKVYPS